MNPSLSATVVALAYARESAAARAEFGGEFRDDVAGFLPLELVEARVVRGAANSRLFAASSILRSSTRVAVRATR